MGLDADLLMLAAKCRTISNDRDMLAELAQKAGVLLREYEELLLTRPPNETHKELEAKKESLKGRMQDFLAYV